jgi:hypothetical protein
MGVAQEMRGEPGLVPLEENAPPPIGEPAEEQQQVDSANLSPIGATGSGAVRYGSDQAYGEAPVGVAYSSVFKDTGAHFYHFAPPSRLGAGVKDGDFRGHFNINLPKVWAEPNINSLFLHRAFGPEKAHLKLGPIYVRFGEVTGAILASDNIDLVENGREAGCIAMVRMGVTVMAQLTEGLQFSLSSRITYLPLTGEVGFFIGRNYAAGGLLLGDDYLSLLATQVSYETMVKGWHVILADDLRSDFARFYNRLETRDDFYLFEGDRYYEDRAGRYIFTAPTSRLSAGGSLNGFKAKPNNQEVVYVTNAISAAADRMLPTDVRATVRAVHENFWYPTGNVKGLLSYRDLITAELASERENLRFKPFIRYEGEKTDRMSGFDHTLWTGIRGPVTDQLFLVSQAGLFRSYTGETAAHWLLRLTHVAGPYTTEALTIAKSATEFHDHIEESADYNIEQILGPSLRGGAFVQLRRLGNNGGEEFSQDEFRTGVRLNYSFSPRTRLVLSAIYADVVGHTSDRHSQTYTGRGELRYDPSDTLTARLLYQYQRLDSNQPNDSYYENVVTLTLTKIFQ